MAGDSLASAVDCLPAPWQGHYFTSLASTQDEARKAAQCGAPDRSVFVANYQSAGRGRQSRRWLAEPGCSLLMSLLFREEHRVPWRFTTLAAVALLRAIEELVPDANVAIKWPNDVMLDDRKVAGILAETTWDGQILQAIVGIGVNVTGQPPDMHASHIGEVDRGELLLAFVRHVETLRCQANEDLHDIWNSHLWRKGQRLRLADLGRDEEVIILGTAPDGSLRVRTAGGEERLTTTGELLP